MVISSILPVIGWPVMRRASALAAELSLLSSLPIRWNLSRIRNEEHNFGIYRIPSLKPFQPPDTFKAHLNPTCRANPLALRGCWMPFEDFLIEIEKMRKFLKSFSKSSWRITRITILLESGSFESDLFSSPRRFILKFRTWAEYLDQIHLI